MIVYILDIINECISRSGFLPYWTDKAIWESLPKSALMNVCQQNSCLPKLHPPFLWIISRGSLAPQLPFFTHLQSPSTPLFRWIPAYLIVRSVLFLQLLPNAFQSLPWAFVTLFCVWRQPSKFCSSWWSKFSTSHPTPRNRYQAGDSWALFWQCCFPLLVEVWSYSFQL